MRFWDLFSKIRDLFSNMRLRDQKTAGAAEPPSLAPITGPNIIYLDIIVGKELS